MVLNFRNIAKTSLVIVYLVIIAGAVVRMTGSGMGCPDWPKCFGYYIPPTNISEVQWQPDSQVKKGQIIIVNESLQVANSDFTTNATFDENNWSSYDKHDYAEFKPVKTWIEYINRLVTVILGIPMLLMLIASFKYYKKDKVITVISVLTIVVLGIQALLGKIVVDTLLKPTMISIHMIIALLLMLMLIYLVYRTENHGKEFKYDKTIFSWLLIAFAATFIQILMGIEVRQFIDMQSKLLGENASDLWLQTPTITFYIHRSFSIVVVILNSLIAYRIIKQNLGFLKIVWVLTLIFMEVVTGIAMNYFNFPFASQPLHLLWASMLLGVQFYLILEFINSKSSHKTS